MNLRFGELEGGFWLLVNRSVSCWLPRSEKNLGEGPNYHFMARSR
jgi:hypothetical protein